MTGRKQLRVRPHNDLPGMAVIEIAVYEGDACVWPEYPDESEVCSVADLPERLLAWVEAL